MSSPGSPLKQSRRWFLGSLLGGLGCAVAWSFPRVGRVGVLARLGPGRLIYADKA